MIWRSTPNTWSCVPREPVGFAEDIAAMAREDFDTFVEKVVRAPVLSAAIVECCGPRGHHVQVVGRCDAASPAAQTMLDSAAVLYVAGAMPTTWSAVQGDTDRPVDAVIAVALASTGSATDLAAWSCGRGAAMRMRCWVLLGSRASVRAFLPGSSRSRCIGWLGDHCVFGQIVMPGAAILELLLAAARRDARRRRR